MGTFDVRYLPDTCHGKRTRHRGNGRVLRTTWARVCKEEGGGVEHYLAYTLRPLEGDRWYFATTRTG